MVTSSLVIASLTVKDMTANEARCEMTTRIKIREAGRVDVEYGRHVIRTAQDGAHPAPFDLFLASIGACSGLYVARFCESRGIPTEGIVMEQRKTVDPETRLVERIEIDVRLPEDFPDRYRDALLRAASLCTVKKHLEHPPEIRVTASTLERV